MKPASPPSSQLGATPDSAAAGLSRRLPTRRTAASATAAPKSASASTTRHAGKSKPLDKRDLMMIVTQLSIMTRSGVDVADAIRSLAQRTVKPIVRQSLHQLHAALEEGNRLSQALAAQGDRFGGIVVASVTAGEASGQLSEVLSRLRILLRDELRTRAAVRSVVSYPIVLAGVTLSVLAAMIFFVLPQFGAIYASSKAPTPAVTQALLLGAAWLRTHWWATPLLIATLALAAWRGLQSPQGRAWIDRQWFRIPVLKSLCRSLAMGRIFRLQGMLLESGVPLLEVLQLTRAASHNSVLRQLNDDMQQAVLVGQTMSTALAEAECVPDGALEMVATAEANGQLAPVLQVVGEFFESEGESQLKDVVKIAEPAIIVGLGVVVGAVVLAVMLPMLDLSSAGGR